MHVFFMCDSGPLPLLPAIDPQPSPPATLSPAILPAKLSALLPVTLITILAITLAATLITIVANLVTLAATLAATLLLPIIFPFFPVILQSCFVCMLWLSCILKFLASLSLLLGTEAFDYRVVNSGKTVSTSLQVASDSEMDHKRLKVLILHGYNSNGRSMSVYLSKLVEELKDIADCEFLDAPIRCEDLSPFNGLRSSKYSKRRSSPKFSWTSPLNDYRESFKLLSETDTLLGPFDVCIGHSQGGCILALIHSMGQQPELLPNLQLSIFLSAFLPLQNDNSLVWKVKGQSLHIWGTDDTVVHPIYSNKLMRHFESPIMHIR